MVRLVLLRILESYFRHRWLYLLPIIIMLLVGGVYLMVKEPKYLSHGIVFVQKESFIAQLTSVRDVGYSWNTPAQEVATEFADLLKTSAFTRAIIQRTSLESNMDQGSQAVEDTLEEVRKAVWAIPQGQNQVLISALHQDPQISIQLVEAAIFNYIQWKINSERVESETALNFFQDLSEAYKVEYDASREELINYLLAHPEPVRGERSDQERLELDQLQSKHQIAETRYLRTLENIESARLSLAQIESNANQTYFIIDAPVLPDKPEVSRKQLAIELAIFIGAGIMLTFLGVGGSTLLNRSFLFPIDVMTLTGLPVLASVLAIKPIEQSQSRKNTPSTSADNRLNTTSPINRPVSPNGNSEVDEPEKQIV
jgi:LPS O-antigen subunit length determinant protein (WzzB/FepE family)